MSLCLLESASLRQQRLAAAIDICSIQGVVANSSQVLTYLNSHTAPVLSRNGTIFTHCMDHLARKSSESAILWCQSILILRALFCQSLEQLDLEDLCATARSRSGNGAICQGSKACGSNSLTYGCDGPTCAVVNGTTSRHKVTHFVFSYRAILGAPQIISFKILLKYGGPVCGKWEYLKARKLKIIAQMKSGTMQLNLHTGWTKIAARVVSLLQMPIGR